MILSVVDPKIIRYIPANRLDKQLKSRFVEKAEIKIGRYMYTNVL